MNIEPSTQLNLYAHNLLLDSFIDLFNKNKLPNKILLSGEKGIGKSTLAYHLINHVLSKNEDYPYDQQNYQINKNNKSYKLIQNQTNPNLNLVDVSKDKKNIDISQIRDLIINLNKTSLNSKPRFVLIDNIELLNINAINALLKIIEEPNKNVIFILINNNKKIYPTLKSRCLPFKIFMSHEQTIKIVNKLIDTDIYELINKELVDNYVTIGKLLKLVKFSQDLKIDLKDIDLKKFITKIIKDKIYKKNKLINEHIYSYIQLYFRNNISVRNIRLNNLYSYFIKLIDNTKIYNLDEESLFLEFENKVLNG